MMRRRDFIALVGGAAVWPLAARAQQPAMPVIGYLGSETPDLFATRLTAFRQGLGATGFDEGRNVAIEFRWADGQPGRLPALAADLVRRQVAVIAAPGSAAAGLAAKAATTTIPVVFETGLDPIEAGLVKSLNRPDGNVTGITSLNADVAPKGLELLHELIPQAKKFSVLVNRDNAVIADIIMKGVEASSRAFGLELQVLDANTESDFDAVFAKLVQPRTGGLLIAPNPVFNTRAQQLAALALKYAVPTVHGVREFALAGGLMSYGGNIRESHRQAGIYTGRILKGEKPANLPVQQATKVELYINLKTAKALGVNIPNTLIGRADEVIE
ncbi:MAG TPA: ABC transporter substrate-binding protein [Pseudolabrys sp.]|jgi:putative ABC transport system substrate-binding protein|nr:ABC transporter substrate-binding protein [Pseudolabrys sp.]